jgi:ribosomal protein S12 methylthiotransferase
VKTIYIENLGCFKNQVDAEKMIGLLESNGFVILDSPEDAQIIIVNTCCFIKSAKIESIDNILELIKYKKNGKCSKFIVSGCMAEYYNQALKEEIPEIDLIFGIGDLSKILDDIRNNKKGISLYKYEEDKLFKRKVLSYPGSAYLKISDGCSNHCSYCIIPMIRGELRSRHIENILTETDALLDHNINELILIAQDTANYGIDIYNSRKLGELITSIDKKIKKDNFWIRVLYMHPDHIDKQLLTVLKNTAHFIPYFDIPFQSGSDKILKLMGRQKSSKEYFELIDDIRNIFSDPVLRTTFIAGFPFEDDNDFKDTINFIKKCEFDWIGGFTYSREEESKSASMKKHNSEKIKKQRLNEIYLIADELTKKRMKRFVDTCQKILIEERIEEQNLFIGRFWGQAPDVDGLTVVESASARQGEFIDAKIIKMNEKDFFASSG